MAFFQSFDPFLNTVSANGPQSSCCFTIAFHYIGVQVLHTIINIITNRSNYSHCMYDTSLIITGKKGSIVALPYPFSACISRNRRLPSPLAYFKHICLCTPSKLSPKATYCVHIRPHRINCSMFELT